MKVLIDIGHPAHVHYFKYLIRELEKEGHQVVLTARDKEMTHELLHKENFEYISRGKGATGLIGKLVYLIKADRFLYKIAKEENPDLFLSFASPYCAYAAWMLGKPCIILDDTEIAKLNHWLYRSFATKIVTPQSYRKTFGKKHFQFPSFMELSYLHPNRFQPDPDIYHELGLGEGEKYVLLRFVSLKANHDIGVKGICMENKRKAIREFSEIARVFISSEPDLPSDLKKYKLPTKSDRIHHVIAFANLVYGESATMSSEAAALGIPSVFVNKFAKYLGTINDQEKKWGLVHSFSDSMDDQIESIEKGIELLRSDRAEWKVKREDLISKTIDPIPYFLKEINTFQN